jgi:alcohol dehydrogenase class IV
MDTSLLINLRKFIAPEIVYGSGALSLAGQHALHLGAKKVCIISDPGVAKAGWTQKVEESVQAAGLDFFTTTNVSENPKDHEVMEGAQRYLENNCDLILAVGGGSAMDCAKGIGIIVTNPGHITRYEGVNEVQNPVPPLIFIPTTAGTSADISQFAIINDTKRNIKFAIISKMVIPDIALVDPDTTITMSPELTAATGMDALCHAFEAYVSTASSPLTDMAAYKAVELINSNLASAFKKPDDLDARNNMMMASLMAGLAFSNAGLGLVHAMAHTLGGSLDMAHGECNAILLEHVVAFNFPSTEKKYTLLTRAMGINQHQRQEQAAEKLVSAIQNIRLSLGISQNLKNMGASPSDLSKLAEFAILDPCVATNPQQTSVEDIEKIFHQIYE